MSKTDILKTTLPEDEANRLRAFHLTISKQLLFPMWRQPLDLVVCKYPTTLNLNTKPPFINALRRWSVVRSWIVDWALSLSFSLWIYTKLNWLLVNDCNNNNHNNSEFDVLTDHSASINSLKMLVYENNVYLNRIHFPECHFVLLLSAGYTLAQLVWEWQNGRMQLLNTCTGRGGDVDENPLWCVEKVRMAAWELNVRNECVAVAGCRPCQGCLQIKTKRRELYDDPSG